MRQMKSLVKLSAEGHQLNQSKRRLPHFPNIRYIFLVTNITCIMRYVTI